MSIAAKLYIKRHSQTGLMYFGKTVRDPYKYKGSGTVWSRTLKKYGNEVETLWVSESFTKIDDIKEFALFFSEFHNIVDSKQWANLIPENGCDGGIPGSTHSTETRAKIAKYNRELRDYSYTQTESFSKALKAGNVGRTRVPQTEETKKKISDALKDVKHNDERRHINSMCHLGVKASDETRAKMSKSQKGRKMTEEQKQHAKDVWVIRKAKKTLENTPCLLQL